MGSVVYLAHKANGRSNFGLLASALLAGPRAFTGICRVRSLRRSSLCILGSMTSAQRRLSVVALGFGFWAAANAVNRWLDYRNADGGWFNYAPNNDRPFSPETGILRGLLVWLAAIGAWWAVSFFLLRQGAEDE